MLSVISNQDFWVNRCRGCCGLLGGRLFVFLQCQSLCFKPTELVAVAREEVGGGLMQGVLHGSELFPLFRRDFGGIC